MIDMNKSFENETLLLFSQSIIQIIICLILKGDHYEKSWLYTN